MPRRAASPAVSENEFDISNALFGPEDAAVDSGLGNVNASRAQIIRGGVDIGFESSSDDDDIFISEQQAKANRKTVNAQGKKVKSGGFQSMGLDANLVKAIQKKGFNVPTPIQRKAIPLILDGQDVVGNARTGSGKTAAFVVPMIQQLKAHKTQVGARALILSPSRELALQTVKVANELGKGTDLRTMLIVGGDSMEDQFKAMTSNPDIIIATPGRFLHLQIEMGLDLSSFKYVVFDEADRLFEMGFAAQLSEILHGLPTSRQTLLFSATLPKSLVEFARAGLSEPKLVRLDTENKISADLENAFFTIKSEEKEAALLHLLNDVIELPTGVPEAAQKAKEAKVEKNPKKRKRPAGEAREGVAPKATIIFVATKHHVEYIATLLRTAGFAVSYLYSSLDQTARKINIQAFRTGQTSILVVTDIAARGVDIPVMSNVINYDFSSSAKLWVHRVGRTARAGRKGWSYNLTSTKDIPYMLDLQLFLSKRMVVGRDQALKNVSFAEDFVVGTLPRDKLLPNIEWVNKLLDDDGDIAALRSVSVKGEKLYNRTRNSASSESVKRAKLILASPGINEINLLFADDAIDTREGEREDLLARIRVFRPEETVFEIGKRGQGNETADLVRKARERMEPRRIKQRKVVQQANEDDHTDTFAKSAGRRPTEQESEDLHSDVDMASASEDELEITFSNGAVAGGRSNEGNTLQDSEFFMSYVPRSTNLAEDRALGVHTGSGQQSRGGADFLVEARGAAMDMVNDELKKGFGEPTRAKGMRWDKKSKKYVSRANDEDGSRGAKSKYIKGESGQKIAASFRSGRFDAWKKAQKMDRMPRVGEREGPGAANAASRGSGANRGGAAGDTLGRGWHKQEKAPKEADKYRDDYHVRKKRVDEAREKRVGRFKDGKGKSEIKGLEDMHKERKLKERRQAKNGRAPSSSGRGGRGGSSRGAASRGGGGRGGSSRGGGGGGGGGGRGGRR